MNHQSSVIMSGKNIMLLTPNHILEAQMEWVLCLLIVRSAFFRFIMFVKVDLVPLFLFETQIGEGHINPIVCLRETSESMTNNLCNLVVGS